MQFTKDKVITINQNWSIHDVIIRADLYISAWQDSYIYYCNHLFCKQKELKTAPDIHLVAFRFDVYFQLVIRDSCRPCYRTDEYKVFIIIYKYPEKIENCGSSVFRRIQEYLVRQVRSFFTPSFWSNHRDETGLVCLPTQLERTLQLYW